MSWKIYHKDGSFLTDVNDEQITINGLEYSDSWMGECFLTIDFKHESPILFEIGDYIMYRGERFELNYDPGKEKQARVNTYGEGFVYDSVKFNALQDELSRTEFLDVVLNDNQLHYTSLPKFSFYVETIDDLLDRIQANLNEQIGEGKWKIFSRSLKRSMQRGVTEEEWKAAYGDEETSTGDFDSKSITIDSKTCWEALALSNSEWDLNFVIRNRNVYVGTAGKVTEGIFRYGLGKGLYEIDQNADSDQSIITRLRAYGSEKNLPERYYADLGSTPFLNVTGDYKPSSTDKGLSVMLEDSEFDGMFSNVKSNNGSNLKHVLVSCKIDDYQFGAELELVLKEGFTCTTRLLVENNKTVSDAVKAKIDAGFKQVQFLSGAKATKFNKDRINYIQNLPNNMSINRLMLPGFPRQSLKEFYDTLTDDEKKYVNPTDREHVFSTDKYRPYIDSINLEKIGLRSGSQFFDNDDKTNGVIDIYPTIEEMEIGGVRVDEIYTGSNVDDNGRFDDGQTVANIDIFLNPAIDFDINDLRDDDFTISMKDGMCGGRDFKVASCSKIDGKWRLTIERVKDDALNLWFPYKDYQIKNGDHFVLTGIELPDSYIRAASLKLLKYAIALLDKNDYTRYVYQPKVDEIFMARQHDLAMDDKTGAIKSYHDTLKAGDLMRFEDEDLGIDAEITIDQLTIKEEDGKIPTYEVTLREDKEVGTIQKIQQQISSLESGNGGTGGATMSQVKSTVASEGSKYFLSKLTDDTAKGAITFEEIQKFLKGLTSEQLSQFNKGATFGNFISSILVGTGAKIDELGNGEFESITSRNAIIAKELIVNRQTAIESNFFTTESGVVDEVTEIPTTSDGGSTTYELKLQKRWDNDFTAFHEQDCVRASINTLMENGKYYDMWFRVLSVNTVTNTITVVMYPDDEVPSKKNYPPCELARLIRWGNPVDKARQRLWYLSAEDGTIILLNHVTKPIIDKSNYSIAIGLLPSALSFVFQDFPNADPNDGAIYTKWIAAENFVRKDYEGNVRQDVIDRGLWSLEVAKGDAPYRSIATEVHDVWHYGCRWRCLEDKTTLEPMYSSQGWAFVEGNPDFAVEMTSSNGWDFDCDRISERDDNGDLQPFTTLSFNATLYNRDVKDHVLPKNVIWTRDTGNPQEDNAWAVKKANSGFNISLTWEDLGTNANERWKCTFKVQATIIDETASLSGTQRMKVSSDKINFSNE